MEFGTLAVGSVLLWRYRFPFMLMPIAVTLWYMSMDLVPFLITDDWQDWEIRKFVSLCFGLLFVVPRLLGGHPLAAFEGLRLLALSLRRDHVLGRAIVDEQWQRTGASSSIACINVGDDPDRRGTRAAGVCGVRRTGRRRLLRLPRVAGVQG